MLAALILLAVGAAPAADAEALLAEARAEYEALEFERVLETTDRLAALDAGAGPAFIEAQVLRGSALAVLGRIVEAETPFRLALRMKPELDLPLSTPPKILAVFRKVQVDERALAKELAEVRRQRLISELELRPDLPATHEGGRPLPVGVRVDDPRGGVARVTVSYRMGLAGEYDTLSLTRGDGGWWRAEIAGARTANDDGVVMCWFVETFSRDGERLAVVGRPDAPKVTQVSAGTPDDHRALTSRWWFWTAIAGAVAAGTVTAVVVARSQSSLPDSDLGPVSFR